MPEEYADFIGRKEEEPATVFNPPKPGQTPSWITVQAFILFSCGMLYVFTPSKQR